MRPPSFQGLRSQTGFFKGQNLKDGLFHFGDPHHRQIQIRADLSSLIDIRLLMYLKNMMGLAS